ncbi:hypothetical protein [Zavarzinia compransoris]|uniref:Transporter n=1 Tax=Zavarzinia compransoris TaxID=1264899 RepID=A0A317E2Q0_9PROT|nr:hypothetical protein [Zavarzinia compransoris]PWR20872.1 hypothetical protein DKG75_12840 [Zavarzinia compransoris]TDP44292.1 hypothetical protein DES42_10757 [Zavarzinia compransoris]
MRARGVLPAAALALALAFAPAAPAAAAWCEAPGRGLVITAVSLAHDDEALDRDGDGRPVDDGLKLEISPWVQYGLDPGLTAIAQATWTSTRREAAGDQGISALFVALRRELWSGGGQTLSLQPGLSVSPGPAARGRRLGGGLPAGELRLLYGTGFALPWAWAEDGFAVVEIAPRLREGGRDSRLEVGGTLGLRLAGGETLLFQAVSQHAFGPDDSDFAKQQLFASTLLPLGPALSLQLGAGYVVAGRDTPREATGLAALWLRF